MEPVSEWTGNDFLDAFLKNEVSNHRPRRTTGKVVVEKHGTVVTVADTDYLPTIFEMLSTEGFLSAPVMEGSKVVGQITLLDLVKHVNSLFYSTSQGEWANFFGSKLQFCTTPASVLIQKPERLGFVTMNKYFTSFSGLEMMARHKNHSILLMDESDRLCGILTQSMLVSFLRQIKNKWPISFKNLKVRDFKGLPPYAKLQTIAEDETAINAFLKMQEYDVYGLPIVDHRGVLTGCISVRDLRGVATDGTKFHRLFETVRRFKDETRAEHERLAPTTHYSGRRTPYGAVYVTPDDTMEDVINKMDDGNLHRVFVCSTDSHRKNRPVPTGVISQCDVLFQALGFCIDSSAASMRKTEAPPKEQIAHFYQEPRWPEKNLRRYEEIGEPEKKPASKGKRSIAIL